MELQSLKAMFLFELAPEPLEVRRVDIAALVRTADRGILAALNTELG